jgi:glycosyltransferase involved in cell wall biosynthesis
MRAAQDVPHARFAIAGEGPERARLEQIVSSLGLSGRVAFLGHRSDVPDLLAAADIFALPSLYEGAPLSVLEAMAAGKAIVTSSIAGTNELVRDDESALLVEPGDAIALAAALRRMLADSALRARLGAVARERAAADFSVTRATERVTRVYEHLLARQPARIRD